jgi:hypothetical protein
LRFLAGKNFVCTVSFFLEYPDPWGIRHSDTHNQIPGRKNEFLLYSKKTLRIRVSSSSFFAYFSMVVKCQGDAPRMRKKNFLTPGLLYRFFYQRSLGFTWLRAPDGCCSAWAAALEGLSPWLVALGLRWLCHQARTG